jgi:hypothetical protein
MSISEVHPAGFSVESLLAECDVRRLRRSGPGGQRRNKVETAVVLRHRPTGIEAEAAERRNQAENRSVAVFRLRVNLAIKVRTARSTSEVPSLLWQSRCRGGRVSISTTHDDFPVLLAEVMDVVAVHDGDVKAAAAIFQCTASQLVKLLKKEPRAIATVNQQRQAHGLQPLQ